MTEGWKATHCAIDAPANTFNDKLYKFITTPSSPGGYAYGSDVKFDTTTNPPTIIATRCARHASRRPRHRGDHQGHGLYPLLHRLHSRQRKRLYFCVQRRLLERGTIQIHRQRSHPKCLFNLTRLFHRHRVAHRRPAHGVLRLHQPPLNRHQYPRIHASVGIKHRFRHRHHARHRARFSRRLQRPHRPKLFGKARPSKRPHEIDITRHGRRRLPRRHEYHGCRVSLGFFGLVRLHDFLQATVLVHFIRFGARVNLVAGLFVFVQSEPVRRLGRRLLVCVCAREKEREGGIHRERENLFILLYILLHTGHHPLPFIYSPLQVSVLWKFFSRFATKQKEHHGGDDDREND